jgi:hypothetical protein
MTGCSVGLKETAAVLLQEMKMVGLSYEYLFESSYLDDANIQTIQASDNR